MIVRALLVLITVLFAILTLKIITEKKSKKLLAIIPIVFALISAALLAYSFSTAFLTVPSKLEDEKIVDMISNAGADYRNNKGENPYTLEISDLDGRHTSYSCRSLKCEKAPTDAEVENFATTIILENDLMGVDNYDKFVYKKLYEKLLVKSEKNGITYWFIPTLLEPYNPDSFLLKGCMYSENCYNIFVWYDDGYLYSVYEICNYRVGKTNTDGISEAVNRWLTDNGETVS